MDSWFAAAAVLSALVGLSLGLLGGAAVLFAMAGMAGAVGGAQLTPLISPRSRSAF